jgi:hypothetical protein
MERVLRWQRDQRGHLTCHLEDDYFSAEERDLLPPGVGVEQPCPPH